MKKNSQFILMIIALLLAAGLIQVRICVAEDFDMQGWGINDPYNKYYHVGQLEKFRACVVGFKAEPPMPGMSPGTIMVVRDGIQITEVHICPAWFATPADVGIRKGERVKIKGCRAKIDGKDVFMASKVKKGNFFEFKMRLTATGKPFWALTPEELVREKAPESEWRSPAGENLLIFSP